MIIYIKTLSGKTITLDVDPNDSVMTIKGYYKNKTGIPPVKQRMIFQGKELELNRQISEYKIVAKSTIYVMSTHLGSHCVKINEEDFLYAYWWFYEDAYPGYPGRCDTLEEVKQEIVKNGVYNRSVIAKSEFWNVYDLWNIDKKTFVTDQHIKENKHCLSQLGIKAMKYPYAWFTENEKILKSNPQSQQEEKKEEYSDDKICPICMDNKKSHALSCGHIFCEGCARQLKKCAFCSKEVTAVIKLFNY